MKFLRVAAGLFPMLLLGPHPVLSSPGIHLWVDATEISRKILHVKETISVKPGPLTIYYPQWIPGEHGPTGPLTDMAGLTMKSGGETIQWRRDLDDMFAVHCTIPADRSLLDITFDFILAPGTSGFSSAASATPRLMVLSWNQVVMYPLSSNPDSTTVSPGVILPHGWKLFSALSAERTAGDSVRFGDVSLTGLVDAPVLAGEHARQIDLAPGGTIPTHLDIVADEDVDLEITPERVEEYRSLIVQANRLFGAHHYNHYDFLLTLSDDVAHFGLEHHESSDNRQPERTLVDKKLSLLGGHLLPHEYVHSWNGKYRRPAGLATGNFSTPMHTDLLWVYEGLTHYLGKLLTARSGLWTGEEYREDLAIAAARLDNTPGRQWRPLRDVADEAQRLYEARDGWASWRRGVDFYDEGDLIWLQADMMIRSRTQGKKSLDDFCKAFSGGRSGGPALSTYTYDDVVTTLNSIAAADWRAFFDGVLTSRSPHAPMEGIRQSGWKLAYVDSLPPFAKAIEDGRKIIDLRYSIGTLMDEKGFLIDVIPGSPAAQCGLAPAMTVVAFDGMRFSKDRMHDLIKSSPQTSGTIAVIASDGDVFRTYALDYHGGERYPVLQRDTAVPDVLGKILEPLGGAHR